MGSTAGNVTDHANIAGSVTIPAGAASVDITVTPVDDALVEGAETVVRTVNPNANYVVGNPNSATVTIADNEVLPTVTINAIDANAAEAGQETGLMRVTRTGGNNTLSLLVFLSATGSTAGAARTPAIGPIYELKGETGKLNPHVGQKVEVRGTLQNAAASPASGDPSKSPSGAISVDSIRVLASTCPR